MILALVAELLGGETLMTPAGPVDAQTATAGVDEGFGAWLEELAMLELAVLELSGVPSAAAPVPA